MKRLFGYLLTVILLAVLSGAGYCVYIGASYSRIDDGTAIIALNNSTAEADTGTQYTAVTLNLGYAVNDSGFSAWDGGGKSTSGEHRETVTENLYDLSDAVKALGAQLMLFQEADRDSARSFNVDMPGKLSEEFADMAYIYTSTYHTPFLLYPFSSPLKRVSSGLASFSSFGIRNALRRSLPTAQGIEKYISPDCGYSVFTVNVDGDRKLYVYNVQIAGIDDAQVLARSQLQQLFDDMASRASDGYVICGGDFGCSLTGEGFLSPLPADLLPEGFSVCVGDNAVPTCRSTASEYVEGETPTAVSDGFIISSSVECVGLETVDLGFTNSDHNPVKLDFKLK